MNKVKKLCSVIQNTVYVMSDALLLLLCFSMPTAKLMLFSRQVASEKHPRLLDYFAGLFAQHGAPWIRGHKML